MTNHRSLLTRLAPLAAVLGLTSLGTAQFTPNPNLWYRLTTLFQGDNVAMDVINDGNNNRMQMVPAGPFTGQYWRFSPFAGFPGRYRISCMWQGENLPMDIINGGPDDNQVILAPIGPFSGQAWSMIDAPAAGHVYLRTEFRGPGFQLEGFGGTTQDRPRLDPAGPFSGQMWKLTPLLSIDPATSTSFGAGCRGRGGLATLGLTNQPWIRENMTGQISGVPSGGLPLLIIGAPLPNPIDLAVVNSPGCLLHLNLSVQIFLPPVLNVAPFSLPIPNAPDLVGQILPMQGAIADIGGTPTIATTNGLNLRFGLR